MSVPLRCLLICLLGLGTACATSRPEKVWPAREPHPYRLLIATPSVDFDREAFNDDMAHRYSVETDVTTLRDALRETLLEANLFEDVEPLPPLEEGEEAMARAAAERADLLLEVRLRKRVATYMGRNGLYVPNVLLWIVLWTPSWIIRDETFELGMEIEVTLRSVGSGEAVYRGVHTSTVQENLNDFERGWHFLGIFRIPGCLDRQNWRNIDGALGPGVEADLSSQVVSRISEEVEPAALGGRHALVLGISHFQDYRIGSLTFAEADARSMRESIASRLGVPSYNLHVLLNGEADLSGIRSALAELAKRAHREEDEVLIYVASYGTLLDGKPYILPYDADVQALEETAFALDEMAGAFPPVSGPRVTLILDAPFGGPFQGRDKPGLAASRAEEVLSGFLAGPRRRLLTGCQPGEGCMELEDLRHGVFTHYLVEAMEEEASLEEAYAFAERMVREHAAMEGHVQNPGIFRGRHPASKEVP